MIKIMMKNVTETGLNTYKFVVVCNVYCLIVDLLLDTSLFFFRFMLPISST